MGSKISRVASALVVAATALVVAAPDAPAAEAQSADKTSCADAYKSAQVQRKSGALKRSRESLLVCLSDRCPGLLQPDCTRWLTEVEAALPSLAFAAKGADGRDLSSVRVTVDGQLLTEILDGKAIAVDPGNHTIRFEANGEAPIEQAIVVREGEKSRVVSASWAREAEAAAADVAGAAPVHARPPALAWAFGGLGVASLATFGVLAAHGTIRRTDLKASCYGHCAESEISSVKTELAIADAALGVGIVSAAIGTVLFFTGRSSERSPAARARPRVLGVNVTPTKTGTSLGLAGQF